MTAGSLAARLVLLLPNEHSEGRGGLRGCFTSLQAPASPACVHVVRNSKLMGPQSTLPAFTSLHTSSTLYRLPSPLAPLHPSSHRLSPPGGRPTPLPAPASLSPQTAGRQSPPPPTSCPPASPLPASLPPAQATEYHLGQLKCRLAKLRTELQAPPSPPCVTPPPPRLGH